MESKVHISISDEVAAYLSGFIDLPAVRNTVLFTSEISGITLPAAAKTCINLEIINNIRYINKFFEHVNQQLENENIFIGCVETLSARRARKKIAHIPVLGNINFLIEFIFLRAFPKIFLCKKIYFYITKGKKRLLSKAETLGRLVCCGFDIVDYHSINGILYFVVKKVREPKYDMHPSYGLLYKMPRIGKGGKIIGVYKFRTMHPYAEYLQDYIVRENGYNASGKPAADFRLTPWGKFFRKYWLDELPQLLNVLKGELKLVGVRPVSKSYFQDIPEDLKELRLNQRPGCIPPYVSLNANGDVSSVQQAEMRYLCEKSHHPFKTDTVYLAKAIFNILVKRKRSA
jgi:lipopolysaccharide/colanic/teichoic acid biosynthesis glycosyltransferase